MVVSLLIPLNPCYTTWVPNKLFHLETKTQPLRQSIARHHMGYPWTSSFWQPTTYMMWLSKFSSGHSAIGKTMARWGQWDSNICPAYQTTTKTTEQILFCTHPSHTMCWHQQTSTLVKWLHDSDTHPDIISIVDHVLTQWGSSSFSSQVPPQLHKAALAQDHIGLFDFLMGRIPSLWLMIQAHYLSSLESNPTALMWAKQFCQQLLQFSHSLWLSHSIQIKSLWQDQELLQLNLAIRAQFDLSVQDLLPTDHFYVIRESENQGFDLESVLAMDLSDKHLWLSAIQDARLRGSMSDSWFDFLPLLLSSVVW